MRKLSKLVPRAIFCLITLFCVSEGIANAQTPVQFISSPRPQFYTASGLPLSGGCLWFYNAGTSNLGPVYTDATGVYLASNPIILDAGGGAQIWIANQLYDVAAFSSGGTNCSTGVQQWKVYSVSAWQILNSLSSIVLNPQSVDPTGTAGQLYYNSNFGCFRGFAGNVWNCLASVGTTNTWNATQAFTNITSGQINGTCYIDGTINAASAAGINSAFASGCTDVWVPPTANSLTDAIITTTKGSTLHFQGSGTFTMQGIRLPDSSSDNTGTGNLDCPDGAELQLASGQNRDLVSDVNFSSLTGSSNFYGWVNSFISGCVLDGNKSGNSSGYALRVYGRGFRLTHVKAQNAAQSGAWTEWGGAEADSSPLNELEAYFIDWTTNYNTVSGWVHKGPHDSIINGYVSDENGSWGVDVQSPISISNANIFNNDNTSPGTAGGVWCHNNGSLFGNGNQFSTNTAGWGELHDTTGGTEQISGSLWSSATGPALEVRNTSPSVFMGGITGVLTGTSYLYLNAAGNDTFVMSFGGGTRTFNVKVNGEVLPNTIIGNSDGIPTAWFSGTPAAGDILFLPGLPGHASTAITQLPATQVLAYNGLSVNLPFTTSANSTLLSNGNTDKNFQTATVAGCTTGNTTGANCASPATITWTTPFANTNYNVQCTGYNPTNTPTSPYIVNGSQLTTGIQVNYFTILASNASYATVFCTASER